MRPPAGVKTLPLIISSYKINENNNSSQILTEAFVLSKLRCILHNSILGPEQDVENDMLFLEAQYIKTYKKG